MTHRKKALFAAIVVVTFFVGTELLLRVIGFGTRAAAPGGQFHVPEIHSAGYDVDPDVFWRLKSEFQGRIDDHYPWDISINSHRMRGPEFEASKPEGTIRILSIGDSTAFGWGVPEPNCYARRLERLLNDRLGSDERRYEVLNAGVPGYTSHQGLAYLRRDLLQLEPDIVLTYFGLNDLTGARFYSDAEQVIRKESRVSLLLRRSRLYQVIWTLMERPGTKDRFDNYFAASDGFRVSPEEYRENLSEIRRLVEEGSGRVLFVRPTWPSPDRSLWPHPPWLEEPVDILDGLSPVADAYTVFRTQTVDVELLFLDMAHPTEHGHGLMADEILRALVGNGLVSR